MSTGMVKEPYYPPQSPISTGLRGRCPRCGQGKLFEGYLKVAPKCSHCGLDFSFSDSGDAAAWFVMLIAGTLAMAGVLIVELNWRPDWWVHVLVAVPLAIGVPLILLRPIKGILLNQQYHTSAREGRLTGE
jgi:uncharacterized protein (DUF983 family)